MSKYLVPAIILICIISLILPSGVAAAPDYGKPRRDDPATPGGGGGFIGRTAATGWMYSWVISHQVDISIGNGARMRNWVWYIANYWRGWKVVAGPYQQGGRWYVTVEKTVTYGTK